MKRIKIPRLFNAKKLLGSDRAPRVGCVRRNGL